MPLGLFLLFTFSFGGHLPQTSGFRSAKQILVVSFTTQGRARILSDRNIFCTLGEGQQRRGLMPLGLFLSCHPAVRTGSSNTHFFPLFFLVVTYPRPPVFARPNKYSSCLPLHRLGLVSWVSVTYFTRRGEGQQRRSLMPLGVFLLFVITLPSGRGLVIPVFLLLLLLLVTCPRPPLGQNNTCRQFSFV